MPKSARGVKKRQKAQCQVASEFRERQEVAKLSNWKSKKLCCWLFFGWSFLEFWMNTQKTILFWVKKSRRDPEIDVYTILFGFPLVVLWSRHVCPFWAHFMSSRGEKILGCKEESLKTSSERESRRLEIVLREVKVKHVDFLVATHSASPLGQEFIFHSEPAKDSKASEHTSRGWCHAIMLMIEACELGKKTVFFAARAISFWLF